MSRWPVRQSAGASPSRPGQRDEAQTLGAAKLVRDDLEARGFQPGGEDAGRPRLVARRIDRLGADELPGELDDLGRPHYFGSTCVAIAAAPRRARGRRTLAVTCSDPSPVSERTYSSWYLRSSEGRPSSVPTTQPRKPSGMQ